MQLSYTGSMTDREIRVGQQVSFAIRSYIDETTVGSDHPELAFEEA